MVKSKFTPEQKIQTVLESIRTGTSMAEQWKVRHLPVGCGLVGTVV